MSVETSVKRGPGRPLSPCGTMAAYRRHYRLGEPVDAACQQANARHEQDRARAKREAAVAAVAPQVIESEGVVTITASLDDARALAAAALDRAMVLEKASGATAQAVDQRAKGAMLRAVHKRVATIARAAA